MLIGGCSPDEIQCYNRILGFFLPGEMTCETKTWLVLHLILLVACYMQHCVHGESQVPCLFIFGDSTSDNGNNNNLVTQAKANYKPYGIDFPTGTQTGRFTNGVTTIDYIAQFLGFVNSIPPFANTTGLDILKGVNYASGAAGILPETGKHLGANIDLGSQFQNHRTIFSQIVAKHGGSKQAKQYLKKCLYYVNIGSNDYINNYFKPQNYLTSSIYNPEQYSEVLIKQLFNHIQGLRNVGARKFVLVGLGQIGCTPNAIATNGRDGSCAEDYNAAALLFSLKLKSLVDLLNAQHRHSKSIFVNSTAGTLDSSLGFTVVNAPCCPIRSDGQCRPNSIPCQNRREYVFFDGFHPTSAVNYLSALTSYNSASNPATTYPMDIQHLAQYVLEYSSI